MNDVFIFCPQASQGEQVTQLRSQVQALTSQLGEAEALLQEARAGQEAKVKELTAQLQASQAGQDSQLADLRSELQALGAQLQERERERQLQAEELARVQAAHRELAEQHAKGQLGLESTAQQLNATLKQLADAQIEA